jgi:alkylation response protein AidB-like acyl-CoA dehydrogenase
MTSVVWEHPLYPLERWLAKGEAQGVELAVWVTERAIQMLGGNGYTREFPVKRFHRDAKDLRHLRGHRRDPAARDLEGDLGDADQVEGGRRRHG